MHFLQSELYTISKCRIPGNGLKTFKSTCVLSPWFTENWCIYA